MSTSAYAHVTSSDGGISSSGGGGLSSTPDWAAVGSAAQEHQLNEPDAELGLGSSSAAGAVPPTAAASKHKVASLFHILFKVSALLVYLFSSLFFDNFIIVFVTCVLLLAFDFWTVKNVTGRLLVGLRWWNEVREDGSNVWIFESKPEGRDVHPADSMLFWGALYATPVVWLLLGVGSLLKPQWLLIVCVAITFSGANVVGYWKCQRDQGRKIQSFLASRVLQAAVPGVPSS